MKLSSLGKEVIAIFRRDKKSFRGESSRFLSFTLRSTGEIWSFCIDDGAGEEIPLASGYLPGFRGTNELFCAGNKSLREAANHIARAVRLLHRWDGCLSESYSDLEEKMLKPTLSDYVRRWFRKRTRTTTE